MSQFRVSKADKWNNIATFAICVAPGYIGNHIIILILDEYLSFIGVPIVSKSKSTNFEPI